MELRREMCTSEFIEFESNYSYTYAMMEPASHAAHTRVHNVSLRRAHVNMLWWRPCDAAVAHIFSTKKHPHIAQPQTFPICCRARIILMVFTQILLTSPPPHMFANLWARKSG